MKAPIIIATLYLLTLTSIAQVEESKPVKIRLRHQNTFGALPELFEIGMAERKVDYISPITLIPAGSAEIKTKKFSRKRWNEIAGLINALDFDTLESSSSHGIDGAWYRLRIIYSNGTEKKFEIWSDYAPEALTELYRKLKKYD